MSKHKKFLSIAAVTGVLLASLTTGAQASSDAPESISHEEALELDSEELAKTSSQDPQELLERLALEDEIGPVIEDLRVSAGARLAAIYVEPDQELAINLVLTGNSDFSELTAFEARSPVPIAVRYGAQFSEAQLIEAATEMAAELSLADVQGVDGVEVGSSSEGLVVITNNNANSHTEEAVDDAAPESRSTLGTRARTAQTSIPITVERHEGEASDSVRGGIKLTSCTSGFSVKNSSGTTGFVTAGHCPNTQKYSLTTTGSAANSSTFQKQARTSTADLQWHSTPNHTDYKNFFGSSSDSATTVTGTGVAYVGKSLCHRGSNTGYSCGLVTSISYTPAWSNACNGATCSATFVRVAGASLAEKDGDSGGPWFSGGTAYGIHKGGSGATSNAWAVYTPISRLSAIGVSLYR